MNFIISIWTALCVFYLHILLLYTVWGKCLHIIPQCHFFHFKKPKTVPFFIFNAEFICHLSWRRPKNVSDIYIKKKHKAKPAHDAKKPTSAPLLYLKRTLALASRGRALSKPLPLLRSEDDFISPGPSSSPEESLYWIISLCWGSTWVADRRHIDGLQHMETQSAAAFPGQFVPKLSNISKNSTTVICQCSHWHQL